MNRLVRISLLGLMLFSVGCRSLDKALFVMPTAAMTPKLPALQVQTDAKPLQSSGGAAPEDAQKLFQLELQRNLMEPKDSALFGVAKLQITTADTKRAGKGLHVAQLALLLTPTVLGIPLEYFRTNLKAELQIIDVNGNVLGTYQGKGSSNIRVAMYHGYSQKGAPQLADVEALRQALNEIRPQLAADASTLREQLILAAYPNEVTISEIPGVVTDSPDKPNKPAPAPADSTKTATPAKPNE
jgi:hypothetical protein